MTIERCTSLPEGEATVGEERRAFRGGDAVEVAVRESLDLRPLTKEVRWLAVVFADTERSDADRRVIR